MILSPFDNRLSWPGAISMEDTATQRRPWRIPYGQRTLFAPALLDVARMQAGIRLAFHTSSTQVSGRIASFNAPRRLDLFVNGCVVETLEIKAGASEFHFANLGFGEKLVELWLPLGQDFALEQLQLDDNATVRPYEDIRPKWITYGSSITHSAAAHSPSRAWPALVAQALGWNLTCLGFAGQCHLDTQIALLMREREADYISICAGINIFSSPSLNERTFRSTLIGFVQILREKHSTTPILLISPIYSEPRETEPNSQGWTLGNYRTAVEEAVQLLREAGDRHIHYLDGRILFGESLKHLLPDQLHPNGDGYEALAQNFLHHAAPLLSGER